MYSLQPRQAVILAAGRGERLRPLTDRCPKPLLQVAGDTLLERHLKRLQHAGITDCVINLAHLGHLIAARVGDGARFGMRIRYSVEPPGALETGGGIRLALPLLADAPFWVINADVWSDCAYQVNANLSSQLGHLILIPNPRHHLSGDFTLVGERIGNALVPRFTYSGIGIYTPDLFSPVRLGQRFPLAPLLRKAAEEGRLTGQLFRGRWFDIGTRHRLATAREYARNSR